MSSEHRFHLHRELGEGGFGRVWLATDRERGGLVAIKILHPHLVERKWIVDRFLQEGRLLQDFDHPNVARVFGIGADDPSPYLVFEFLAGRTLDQHIETRVEERRHFSREEIISILSPIGAVITRAHQGGILHRDLKPTNIILHETENQLVPKVLDFGAARIVEITESQATTKGRVVASPLYSAPEQVLGFDAVCATDVFALAVLAFELLTLRNPWIADEEGRLLPACFAEVVLRGQKDLFLINDRIRFGARPLASNYRRGVGLELDTLIQGALSIDPAHRPSDAAAFIKELLRLVAAIDGDAGFDFDFGIGDDRTPILETNTEAQDPPREARNRSGHRDHRWVVVAFLLVLVLAASATMTHSIAREVVSPVAGPRARITARPAATPVEVPEESEALQEATEVEPMHHRVPRAARESVGEPARQSSLADLVRRLGEHPTDPEVIREVSSTVIARSRALADRDAGDRLRRKAKSAELIFDGAILIDCIHELERGQKR